MNPLNNYGYILIDTPKLKEKHGPTRAGDEILSLVGSGWLPLAPCAVKGSFFVLHSYRRPVDPGDGYELIPPTEHCGTECEMTRDGILWEKATWFINRPAAVNHGITWEPNGVKAIAFRRKKDTMLHPPLFDTTEIPPGYAEMQIWEWVSNKAEKYICTKDGHRWYRMNPRQKQVYHMQQSGVKRVARRINAGDLPEINEWTMTVTSPAPVTYSCKQLDPAKLAIAQYLETVVKRHGLTRLDQFHPHLRKLADVVEYTFPDRPDEMAYKELVKKHPTNEGSQFWFKQGWDAGLREIDPLKDF